jgi:Protein of unknown function (DUF3891)
MLLRPDGDAVVCIGQPAHAFLSGQLAAAWQPRPEPFEEVVLAATQHDAGMADWDASPELNESTGLPQSFMEMSLDTHLRLWSHAPHRVLPQSRYAALLVSMHGTALYEMRDLSKLDDPSRVTRYLDEQRELQHRLGSDLDREQLRRNQKLVWAWDFLSLGLCLGWDDASVNGLTLYHDTIEPWPFATETIALHTDGRRLGGRYETREHLHAALDAAPWLTLGFELSRRP